MVYRAATLRGLANSQMVVGAVMIVFGVACIISAQHWSSYVGFGVWVGLWVSLVSVLLPHAVRTNVNDRFSIVLIKHNLQSLFFTFVF